MDEEEMARAVAEGIRRAAARENEAQMRGFFGCLLVAAIFVIALIALTTWNPGG